MGVANRFSRKYVCSYFAGKQGAMNKTGLVLIALTLVASLMGPKPSAAEGAVAIASTGDVKRDGISIGAAVNRPTKETAIAEAIKQCHEYADEHAPRITGLCKIVKTFRRQCFADAYDPKTGTPGAGWAIGSGRAAAEASALAACEATAGADRRGFCKGSGNTICDTHD